MEFATSSNIFPQLPDMEQSLCALLAQIPSGKVTTYGTLARALGDVLASRWVGQFLLHHSHRSECVCHRVVRVDGEIGRHVSRKLEEKQRLLCKDGIRIAQGRVNLDHYLFDDFHGDRPLERLQRIQQQWLRKLCLKPSVDQPTRFCGVDVSYVCDGRAVAVCAKVATGSGQLIWQTAVVGEIKFPYIPSYLAFRELPLLVELVQLVRDLGELPDLLLVDGSGILHQRRAGIATLLGIVAGVPTIGVTKKLLFGEVDLDGLEVGQSRSVTDQGQPIGIAIRPSPTSRRPLFLSPGHLTSVSLIERSVEMVLWGHRLPEPIYWADRLSRREAQRLKSAGRL